MMTPYAFIIKLDSILPKPIPTAVFDTYYELCSEYQALHGAYHSARNEQHCCCNREDSLKSTTTLRDDYKVFSDGEWKGTSR